MSTGLEMPRVRSDEFVPIPSIDLIDGKVVRLLRGDFASMTVYGDPLEIVDSWEAPEGTLVHVVDLEGARTGTGTHQRVVSELSRRGYRVQVGGGIRSADTAMTWLDAGAARMVIGTMASEDPVALETLVSRVGADRVVAGVDLRGGRIRVRGWEEMSERAVDDVLGGLQALGITDILVTEIGRDGTMEGPDFDLYRRLVSRYSLSIQASGGVGTLGDVASLSRISGLSGVIIGRALHERRFSFREAMDHASAASGLKHRVIPCLDIKDGRVVKGVKFAGLRDAGDPVEAAKRYEAEGADELVMLDISATQEGRATSMEIVRRVSESIFIPLTVGGGVRTLEDFRKLIQSGADRVALNSAAVIRPELLAEAATEFGVQAVVLSCDASRNGDRFSVVTHAGSRNTNLDVEDWCAKAEGLGVGEILLTSIDRDGTRAGYDIELLRLVTAAVRIGVIASGGAGSTEHMREAIERGGARAVLAASLFHDGELTIGETKRFLNECSIPVRLLS